MSDSSSASSSESDLEPILTPPPDPIPEPAPYPSSSTHPPSSWSTLKGFDSMPQEDPWLTMPPKPPKLVKSSATISADAISLTTDSTFVTVPNSSSSVEVVYVLETIDYKDIIVHHDILDKNSSQKAFYKQVKKTVDELWKSNSELKLIHGFSIYKATSVAYYTKLSTFHYDHFWYSKLAKDKLIISNHIFGNKHIYLTHNMKDALKK